MKFHNILFLAAVFLVLGFLMGMMASASDSTNSVQQQVIDACVQKGGVPLSDRYAKDEAITDCKFPNDPRQDRFR